jgi:hypothetical protein
MIQRTNPRKSQCENPAMQELMQGTNSCNFDPTFQEIQTWWQNI